MVGPTTFGYQNLGFGAGGVLDLGKLEHLQTQTVSSQFCDFTALQEATYNVHLFTFTDIHIGTSSSPNQTEFNYRLSNDGGTSYETGYQFANQRGIADGSFAERKSSSQDSARLFGDIDEDAHSLGNGYMYLYNAGDSAKYTFATSHTVFSDFQDLAAFEFGSQVYDHSETINAVRFGASVSLTALTKFDNNESTIAS